MSNRANPVVSVIITCFNKEPFIEEAIDSVLNQTFSLEDVEIIIIDNGSSDASPLRCSLYGNKKNCNIVYIYTKPRGLCDSMNLAIGLSHGEFISILDADDFWRKSKLEKSINLLRKDPSIVVVGHRVEILSLEGILRFSNPTLLLNEINNIDTEPKLRDYLGSGFFLGSSMSFRRDFLLRILPIASYPAAMQDYGYISYLAVFFGKVGRINEYLSYYRIHRSNLAARSSDKQYLDSWRYLKKAALEAIHKNVAGNSSCRNRHLIPALMRFLRLWRSYYSARLKANTFNIFLLEIEKGLFLNPAKNLRQKLYLALHYTPLLLLGLHGYHKYTKGLNHIAPFKTISSLLKKILATEKLYERTSPQENSNTKPTQT